MLLTATRLKAER